MYVKDLMNVADLSFDWNILSNKSVLISGATGMIGSFLVDVLMYKNEHAALNCKVVSLGRSLLKAQKRFFDYWDNDNFTFVICDICKEVKIDKKIDFVFHAASNTHPVAYTTDPIGTVTANIIGTYNLLELAVKHKVERFVFASSVEVYGENRGDVEKFNESYCGYINCNTLRAGYPESKRAGEALCQAYIKQKALDVVLPRISRTFGPTMLNSDTKAISQFLKKGVVREDVILKSGGTQFYSYTYVADTVSGILTCLFSGVNGEAYNIADERCDISLHDLAKLIADYAGTKVVFELPDNTERAGYSTATCAVMDNAKLRKLGWKAEYDMKAALERTIDLMRVNCDQREES